MDLKIFEAVHYIKDIGHRKPSKENIMNHLNKQGNNISLEDLYVELSELEQSGAIEFINDAVYIVNENFLSKDTGSYDTQDKSVINVDMLDKSIDIVISTPEFVTPDLVSGRKDVLLNYQSLQAEFMALKSFVMENIDLLKHSSINDSANEKEREHEVEIAFLREELEFLRGEVDQKNQIIKLLAVKSSMRNDDEKSFSYKNNTSSISNTNPIGDDLNITNDSTGYIETSISNKLATAQNSDLTNTSNEQNAPVELKVRSDEISITLETNNYEIQLSTIRNKFHEKYLISKEKPNIEDKEDIEDVNIVNKTTTDQAGTWKKGTCVIVGDSMLYGIDEKKISKKIPVKVRCFPGASIKDMYHYLIPIIAKTPDYIILHVGTNDAPSKSSREIIDDLLSLKSFILSKLSRCKVIISTPIMRTDNAKATLTIKNMCEHLDVLNIDIVDNKNIAGNHLGRKGLHLNNYGVTRFAMNFIAKVRTF